MISDNVRPGVAQLPTGAWFDPADWAASGSTELHGNPNVLTLDKGTSKLGQGPIAHTTLVEVAKVEGAAQPSNPFGLPDMAPSAAAE